MCDTIYLVSHIILLVFNTILLMFNIIFLMFNNNFAVLCFVKIYLSPLKSVNHIG